MSETIDTGAHDSAAAWNRMIACVLEGDVMRSVFQPIVDLQRCVVVGYEALTRFDLPGAPAVGPDRWFAEATRVGVGAELDARALESVFAHRTSLPSNCFLSVNVEPLHLLEPCVRDVFATQGDLAGLVIELTEHQEWDLSELAGEVGALRDRGAIVAIDDAGVGYSGLSRILQIRPSIVKLDQSLIQGIDCDEAKVAMVEIMGAFSSRVDAWLLAEGVETRAEALCLFHLGVPLVQGYYFGVPSAPWVGLPEVVCRDLGSMTRDPDTAATLRHLVENVEPLFHGADSDEPATTGVWRPVIDAHRRPIGVVGPDASHGDAPLQTVIANIGSDPREVAYRVASAGNEPHLPILVIDELGTYRGIVTMRRLLRQLADLGG